MKKSRSGTLYGLRTNFFTMDTADNTYSGIYNKKYEKEKIMEFEIERIQEDIIKLQFEIENKSKEINSLTNNKNRKNEELLKTLKIIKKVVKLVDIKSQKDKNKKTIYNEKIEDPDKKESIDDCVENNATKVRDKEKKNVVILPVIKQGNFNTNERTEGSSLKEILFIEGLKQQIKVLNEEINKKNEEIKQLQIIKQDNINYSLLQNDLNKNYKKLAYKRKENIKIRKNMDDINSSLTIEKTDNNLLKSKLLLYQIKFRDYKDIITKKNVDLQNRLTQIREKERDCRLFHFRKGGSTSMNKTNRNIIQKIIFFDDSKIRLNNAENELKKIDEDIEKFQKQKTNKNNEIINLKDENQNLNEKINKLHETYTNYSNKIKELNKEKQMLINKSENLKKKNKSLNNEYKNKKKKYNNENIKMEITKKQLEAKEKEINDLKNIINDLKNKNQSNNDNNINFNDDLLLTQNKFGLDN